jgi:hypothetical protein
MDHIFEQKLVRENHQLQFELIKLNKQIKQLQEKVIGYEQMFNELSVQEGTEATLNRMQSGAWRGSRQARIGQNQLHGLDQGAQDVGSAHGDVGYDAFKSATSGIRRQITGQVAAGQKKSNRLAGRYGTPHNPDMGSPLGIAMRKRTTSLNARAGEVAGLLKVAEITGDKEKKEKLEARQKNIASARDRPLGTRSPKPTPSIQQ